VSIFIIACSWLVAGQIVMIAVVVSLDDIYRRLWRMCTSSLYCLIIRMDFIEYHRIYQQSHAVQILCSFHSRIKDTGQLVSFFNVLLLLTFTLLLSPQPWMALINALVLFLYALVLCMLIRCDHFVRCKSNLIYLLPLLPKQAEQELVKAV